MGVCDEHRVLVFDPGDSTGWCFGCPEGVVGGTIYKSFADIEKIGGFTEHVKDAYMHLRFFERFGGKHLV